MPKPITAVFLNDEHTSAWMGYEEEGVLRFDFTNKRGSRRFFVMPEKCVMFADESSLEQTIPNASWYIHVVDADEAEPGVWVIEDRELDIVVEGDLHTYRVIDLDDFGQAMSQGRISLPDARRILERTQQFLDAYLHQGKFPPEEIRPWAEGKLDPRPLPLEDVKHLLSASSRHWDCSALFPRPPTSMEAGLSRAAYPGSASSHPSAESTLSRSAEVRSRQDRSS